MDENREATANMSVTGLLRMFDSFLWEPPLAPEPTTPLPTIPNHRFPHESLVWRVTANAIHRLRRNKSVWDQSLIQTLWIPARDNLLQQTERHRRSDVERFLTRNDRVMRRFEDARYRILVLTVESGGVIEMPNGEAHVAELLAPLS